jgi:hypothetical protein
MTLLNSFSDTRIDFRVTKLVEEFLPLLIGMELYFGISAQQFVSNLRLKNEKAVVRLLLRTGYIVGSEHQWKLSKSTIKTVSDRLSKTGAIRSQLTYSVSEDPVSVLTLVKLYNWHLKRVPKQHQGQRISNKFAFFRKLSKKHDSRKIESAIKRFFKNAERHDHDYRLERFASFMENVK